jgi:hypothetical protein
MNSRQHIYIPLGWFVGRLKLIWAGHKLKCAFGKFGKVTLATCTWWLGNGDLTIEQNLLPIIWQSGLGKIGKQKKIAMYTPQQLQLLKPSIPKKPQQRVF